MIICGIKLTHDASIALIEDGTLRFSVEIEKIGGNARYASLEHLSQVASVLSDFGYRVADVDQFVVDGWHPNHLVARLDGRIAGVAPAYLLSGLAATLNVGKPAITRALDTLSRLGFVQRRRDPKDGRNVFVERTEKGDAFLEQLGATILQDESAQLHRPVLQAVS